MTENSLTLEDFNAAVTRLLAEVSKVLVGQEALARQMLITLLAGGNALLEGVPGLGKTLLVRTLAQVVQCSFSRIQFTPDLMPADIVGTMVLSEDEAGHRAFRFEPGPVFANLLLADEINRATPRTQSALLEAMQEQRVTVGRATHDLPSPFFVLATQNPLEMEGTYPLPEAQLDRFFFKIVVAFPTEDELVEIARRTTGAESPTPQPAADGAQVLATHPDHDGAVPLARKHLLYGASPRGVQALILAAKISALLDGRAAASIEDIQAVALPALRHRVILNFEAQAEGVSADEVLGEVMAEVKV